MPQIIASTYEIQEKIGSGGAGIVYLGQHLRLGKQVVLKADKRTLSTKPEILRREVDALKDLSHTYIPQVYDFVAEDETVYTVMDYIEGESLDRPLKRGERFPQAQVIEWGCQLLEALVYLHSRPPHGILHSDIKPANIMLTPQGDIRLIDFNIALALGEEGTVRVGYSRGYASPEHYGIDYSTRPTDSEVTTLLEGTTEPGASSRTGSSSTASKKREVLLDVRSDIYSAGATLYHLFSGERPALDARQVIPLGGPAISPAVSDIIRKAMAPDPDQRYQTAAEMLHAFEHLHENDPRTRRHKRRAAIAAAALTIVFLAGGLCTFAGQQMQAKGEEELKKIAIFEADLRAREERALAAATDSEAALLSGNVPEAVRLAREALELDTCHNARAQKALTDALGVYNLADTFQPHLLLSLPGNPQKAVLSPGGTRAAAITGGQMLVFDTESGERLAALPSDSSALSDVVFAGEDTVIYAGDGALRAYDLSQGRELWSGGAATAIALSADGSTVAAAYRDETSATIYDAATGLVRQTVDFQGNHLRAIFNDIYADPEADLFALDANGTHLAVGFSEGGALCIYNLENRNMDIPLYDQSGFTRYGGGFHGQYLAYTGWDGEEEESVFAIIDVPGLMQTGGFADRQRFNIQTDESGVYFSTGRLLVWVDPADFVDHELAYADDYIAGFSVSSDRISALRLENGQFAVFDSSAGVLNTWDNLDQGGGLASFLDVAGDYALTATGDAPALRLWRLENHREAQVCAYDAGYDHAEARLSADGRTAMLFRYDKFRLMDMDGNVLADVDIPEADQVYDQQYRRDEKGSRLEVIYYSGLVRSYSAADGSVVSEEQKDPPDASLYEEFLTDHLRIERPLHGTPVVYDRETGEMLRELDPDYTITYATQAGDRVIIQYISAQTGEHYGLLMNENLDTLARLPGLCDILEDGRLIFDDMKGSLRQSRIYTAQELMELAREQEQITG